MTPETWFSLANLFALAGWIVLVAGIVSGRAWLRDRLAGIYWPLAISLGYGLAITVGWGSGDGGFSTLSGLRQLFENDWMLLGGWAHYLAFDLFVGAWIAGEAARAGLSRLLLLPILPFAFLFGPVGFLLFQATRFVYRGDVE